MTKEELELKLLDRPHSPLFARLADEYLAANRIDDAKKVCTEGLKKFPLYGTAHLILSKCHFVENNFALALASVENAQACIPDPDLLEGLCEELLAVISKGGGPEPVYDRASTTEEPEISSEPAATELPAVPDATGIAESDIPVITGMTAEPAETTQEEIAPASADETHPLPAAAVEQDSPVAAEPAELHPEESSVSEEVPPQASTIVQESVEEAVQEETDREIGHDAGPEFPDAQAIAEPPSGAEAVSEEIAEEIPPHEPARADEPPTEEKQTELPSDAETLVSAGQAEENPTAPGAAGETTGTVEYQPTETDRIITRTLAEIYASQKAYEEAIVTYRLLKEQKPECMEEIDARIAELQKLQQEKSRE